METEIAEDEVGEMVECAVEELEEDNEESEEEEVVEEEELFRCICRSRGKNEEEGEGGEGEMNDERGVFTKELRERSD
jgi:hypothetical protein